MINYDPDSKPEVTSEMIEFARRQGRHVVNIMCDPEGAKYGEHVGVSFLVAAEFLPRAGEKIRLEDGKHVVVKNVLHSVTTHKLANGSIAILVANVYATYSGVEPNDDESKL